MMEFFVIRESSAADKLTDYEDRLSQDRDAYGDGLPKLCKAI